MQEPLSGTEERSTSLGRRKFVAKDYETMQKWWQKWHKDDAPPPWVLPKTGIMIEVDGEDAAFGFLYNTDSGVCVFEWFCGNPFMKKKDREMALDYLIDCAKEWAEKAGYGLIYSSCGIQRYINRVKSKGFKDVSKNQTHLFCHVGGE